MTRTVTAATKGTALTGVSQARKLTKRAELDLAEVVTIARQHQDTIAGAGLSTCFIQSRQASRTLRATCVVTACIVPPRLTFGCVPAVVTVTRLRDACQGAGETT